ncbi:MAG: site-specific DNA-methyltransferase [Verrucomicrobiota bacterium]|jgi:site-specific DNA-methyltransferase (adenine-specific)
MSVPRLIFSSDTPFLRLYHGNSLELLDAIAAKYPDGRFDAIFADPPYFLSNGGITCHAGKMVKVDKGDWDVSRGPELNHEFNTEWLRRCQKVLKPNGTIWVTGTHHVIFSIGYALQQLGFKILNDIAWEKPNPPPNLSCRYFTHSTETVLWAAKSGKSKHVFNYQEMRKVTGKQMKTVWRSVEDAEDRSSEIADRENPNSQLPSPNSSVWTMTAPSGEEKRFGKHPTQKPVALVERCLLASTNEGDLVLDPFLGNGTTAVASLRLKRGCVGIELDLRHVEMAARRADREIIEIWLRNFRVRVEISVCGRDGVPPSQIKWGRQHANPPSQIDLAIFPDSINGSRDMADVPEIQTERIFHECKFVFLSCAQVERGAVVHTTVDVSLQEAWAKTSTGKKRETTHVVRCETEIFRLKNNSG